MGRHIGIIVVLAALAFLAGGCVSSGTYKAMEADKNQEIAALRQQKEALEKDKADLIQKAASIEQQTAADKQRISSLEQEKASLAASSQQTQKQYEALAQDLSKEVEKGQLQVRQYKNMLSVELAEQIFFDSGRAMLKPEGKKVLAKLGEALKGYEGKIIRVVGHTDNVPISKSAFASNWDLSVARATTVVRFLQEVGIPPERMIAAGRGEYDPVAPNDTREGRQKNRRIEIMLVDKSLASELSRQDK